MHVDGVHCALNIYLRPYKINYLFLRLLLLQETDCGRAVFLIFYLFSSFKNRMRVVIFIFYFLASKTVRAGGYFYYLLRDFRPKSHCGVVLNTLNSTRVYFIFVYASNECMRAAFIYFLFFS